MARTDVKCGEKARTTWGGDRKEPRGEQRSDKAEEGAEMGRGEKRDQVLGDAGRKEGRTGAAEMVARGGRKTENNAVNSSKGKSVRTSDRD